MSCEFGTHLGGKLVSSVSFPPRVPSNLKAAQLSLCPLLLPHVSSILPSLLLPMDTELIMAGVAAREGENSCPEKESASFSLFLSFFCLDTEHLHTQSRKTRTRCGILSSFLFLIVAFPSLPTPPPTATMQLRRPPQGTAWSLGLACHGQRGQTGPPCPVVPASPHSGGEGGEGWAYSQGGGVRVPV